MFSQNPLTHLMPLDSIGHWAANSPNIMSIALAPHVLAQTKGRAGLFEAACSEGLIAVCFVEATKSMLSAYQSTTSKQRKYHLIKFAVLTTIMANEASTIFPRARRHYDEYALTVDKKDPCPITALTQSIGAITTAMVVVKLLFCCLNYVEQRIGLAQDSRENSRANT